MSNYIEVRLSKLIAPNFREIAVSFLSEKYSHYWLSGGRGSGKSTLVSILILIGIIKNPNAHAICARRFKVDLHNSVYSQIIRTINIIGINDFFSISSSKVGAPTIFYKPTMQHIDFVGLDEPENLKSLCPPFGIYKYSWFEEVSQLGGANKMRSVLQSIRRGSSAKFITFYSYNPPSYCKNWVNLEAKNFKANEKCLCTFSTWEDLPNSIANRWLGEDFINDALYLKQTDFESYRHEYLGEQTAGKNAIFKNIKEIKISSCDISKFSNTISGLDFGFANDPTSFCRLNYDSKNKIIYIFDEIYEKHLLNRELGLLIQKKLKDNPREVIFCDSSEPKSIKELSFDFGINAVSVKKGRGSIEYGIKLLQGFQTIFIDSERCPNTFREFTNAEFNIMSSSGGIVGFPYKDNHAIDAVRYSLSFLSLQSGWKRR